MQILEFRNIVLDPSEERFFRSLKEECVWQHNFESFTQASLEVNRWIKWYNQERPHQALDYESPVQFRKSRRLVA